MSLSKNFRFVEKDADGNAFAVERISGRVFRMPRQVDGAVGRN